MMPHDGCTVGRATPQGVYGSSHQRVWHDVVHALGGREALQAAAIESLLIQADRATRILLLDAEGVTGPALTGADAGLRAPTPAGAAPEPATLSGAVPDPRRAVEDAAAVRDAVVWVAQRVLGPPGSACCQHLSERAEWQCAWLDVQRRVVRALLAVGGRAEQAAAGLSLLPLWSGLKGTSGLRSPSPEVRVAAVQLLSEALLALNAPPDGGTDRYGNAGGGGAGNAGGAAEGNSGGARSGIVDGLSPSSASRNAAFPQAGGDSPEAEASVEGVGSPAEGGVAGAAESVIPSTWRAPEAAPAAATAAGGGVSAWTVCRELACSVAAEDTDPRVTAAALRAVAALLALCRGHCGAREWRLVAQCVLVAAGRAREGEVWGAALDFALRHGSQPGWRAAVRHLVERLRTAAADPDGPLLADAESAPLCRALAGAAALEAALPSTAPHAANATDPQVTAGSTAAVGAGAGAHVGAVEGLAEAHAGAGGTEEACVQPSGGWVPEEALAALAACVSDAVRHGARLVEPEPLPRDGGGGRGGDDDDGPGRRPRLQRLMFGGCVAVASPPAQSDTAWAAPRGAASGSAAARPYDGGGTGDTTTEAETAAALAAAALAACCSLGCLRGAAGSLEALEALVGRAETAPLAPSGPNEAATAAAPSSDGPEEQRWRTHTGPGGRLLVSRAGLMAAAAAVALGAAGWLCRSCGGMGGGGGGAAAGLEGLLAPAACKTAVDAASQRVAVAVAVAVRVAALMRRVAALVQDPDKLTFSEVGGAPAVPTDSAVCAAARQHGTAVVAALRALAALLGAFPAPLVLTAGERESGGGGAEGDAEAAGVRGPAGDGESAARRGRSEAGEGPAGSAAEGLTGGHRRGRPQVIIEELPDSHPGGGGDPLSEELQTVREWRRQQQELVPELVLLCATYAPPRSSAAAAAPAAAAAAAADPGLPPPPTDVFTPWAGGGDGGVAAAAAESLLVALHRRVRPQPPPSRALRSESAATGSSSGSLALMPAEVVSEQDVLAAVLPELLRERIRPIVVQRHVQSLEEGPIQPYKGPDTFARALAGRRLAWLLMRSRHPFAGGALHTCLPAVLACCDDPAPGVALYGVAALHAAAVECMAPDLQWQRELLLDQARRLVGGCPEALWPLVCPAAVALVRRIEGRDPRAPGYHRLAPELLTEVERQAHAAARRLAFMPACAALVSALGLTSLRYASRLMPLLLEWLHAPDPPSRLAALRLLAAALRATWPRAGAHAGALWRHLLLLLLRTSAASSGSTGPEAEAEAEVGAEAEAGAEAGAEEGGAAAAEARAAREVCSLLLACAREQILAFQPAAAGLPAGAEPLHRRLLMVVGGPCQPAV